MDYAGVNQLTIAAEALVRSIKALSNLFWISIAGTIATIFLATLASLDGAADGMLRVGEYDIPLSVLPIACLSFAMSLLWLTVARLKMLDVALADQDLTASVARDIFRLDPPVLTSSKPAICVRSRCCRDSPTSAYACRSPKDRRHPKTWVVSSMRAISRQGWSPQDLPSSRAKGRSSWASRRTRHSAIASAPGKARSGLPVVGPGLGEEHGARERVG